LKATLGEVREMKGRMVCAVEFSALINSAYMSYSPANLTLFMTLESNG
jgi:hypothetical protein